MIKAIIFDYFGVISSDEYWRYVKHDQQSDSEFKAIADEVNLGKLDWREFMQKVAQATNTPLSQVESMYESELINPQVVGLIDYLHKTYKTGLLTNAHHDFIDHLLDDNHLKGIFDAVIVSSRLGIVKPDPRIFSYALEQLGVLAEETVYIDDLQRHVNGAKDLGIQAVLYRDFDALKRDLNTILSRDSQD